MLLSLFEPGVSSLLRNNSCFNEVSSALPRATKVKVFAGPPHSSFSVSVDLKTGSFREIVRFGRGGSEGREIYGWDFPAKSCDDCIT